jgi:hypothetical protein
VQLGQEADQILQAAAEAINRPSHHHTELALIGVADEPVKLGHKAKTQTYCEARDIAKQFVQAQQQKENEKVEELADKLIEQQKDLGSEYLALMESLRNANLTSKDAQEIESMFDTLNQSCPD